MEKVTFVEDEGVAYVWNAIKTEISQQANEADAAGIRIAQKYILKHGDMAGSMAALLSDRLHGERASRSDFVDILLDEYRRDTTLIGFAASDILATVQRDPATHGFFSTPFLYHKGFHALQVHRVANRYWLRDCRHTANLLSSAAASAFGIDIHPAAQIGRFVMIDHGNGIVIGETAVVGNSVTILHGVTLGSKCKKGCDRHPKISDGVLIGAHACLLGSIRIGQNSRIGAGAVILQDVPPFSVAVGIPAKVREVSQFSCLVESGQGIPSLRHMQQE